MLCIFNLETNKKEKIEKAKISHPETIPINILVYNYLDFSFITIEVIY